MPKIRNYKPTDQEELQKICVATSDMKITRRSRKWLPIAYNNYYTENQSDYVFVLADDNDKPVGYILCATDEKEYRRVFEENYIPQIRKISPIVAYFMRKQLKGEPWHYEDYPAHMHIDIMPDYQRQGMGTKLIDALVAKLRNDGIVGLQLGCSAKNTKAVAFYKKYGFTELFADKYLCIFGIKIGE